MRILLASANFSPRVGGIERFTETLAAGLAGRGHEVTVACCRYGGAPLREALDGFRIERIPATYVLDRSLRLPYPVPAPHRLLETLRHTVRRSDVVHVQDVLYPTSFPSLWLAAREGIPTVLTQHVAFVPQRSGALDVLEHVALATIGRCIRLATAVTTLNPAVAAWVEAQWGVSGVRVLPVGVPAAWGGGERTALRRSFGLPADRFIALFVGRNVPKKGLDVYLASADPAYELVAVTDRPGGASDATLIPFMSHDRLRELLACVDAFVLPSEGEGLPLSLQEALVSGLPVITTRHPGYEDFLSAEDVLYVDRDPGALRAALRRLVTEPELRRRLSERARAAAERHFSVERFVDAYAALYGEMRDTSPRVGARSRPRPARRR